MLTDLLYLAYPIVLVAALVAAIVRRERLGAAAKPAIGGFATLVAVYGVGEAEAALLEAPELPRFEEGLPGLADFPAAMLTSSLVLTVFQLVGMALLIVAAVRRAVAAGAVRRIRDSRTD
ncbi:hypothetical protein [Actinoplanes solisilvae]|uniref:hypothetical protein n=1 Tax=Actinoplanes solisilvae TaxID=2486853 RepID=UPI000FD92A7E|nr:hypothetical protein [Actinoplanes solisilvae]